VLAGQPPAPPVPSAQVPSSIQNLIERLPDTAALVLDAKYEVLAWNPLAAALLEDFSALSRPPAVGSGTAATTYRPDPARRLSVPATSSAS